MHEHRITCFVSVASSHLLLLTLWYQLTKSSVLLVDMATRTLFSPLFSPVSSRQVIAWRRNYSTGPVVLSFYQTTNDTSPSTLPPVVFLHGLFGSKNNFKSIASHVTRTTGHPCYTVDLRNHGDSPHLPFESHPAYEMAQDVAYFLSNQVKVNLNNPSCYLVGHSLGGRVALQFAHLYRQACVKVIPVDVSPCDLPSSLSLIQYTECMEEVTKKCASNSLLEARKKADQLMQEHIKEKLVRDFLLLNLIRKEDDKGQLNLAWKFNVKVISELLRQNGLRKITIEPGNETQMAFIYGGQSDFLTEQMKPEILRLFPNSVFHCIRDAGHYLHVEKRNEFLAFLTSVLA